MLVQTKIDANYCMMISIIVNKKDLKESGIHDEAKTVLYEPFNGPTATRVFITNQQIDVINLHRHDPRDCSSG